MIIELKDRKIEESIKNLRKAIEIVGGKEYLNNIEGLENFVEDILSNLFIKGKANINIEGRRYEISELISLKIDFEKYFLKNKRQMIQRIVSKIKQYNTSLESKIRKFKKSNSIEIFREIVEEIEKTYKWEFDNFFLVYIDNINEEKDYYGEYLTEKRKQIIDSVLVKLGI
ncbi:hypothetical protein [Clostridium sp.]|uniref:hypothetical protein n=1 Tax=Clostridium sp. TaxID=1506 RepID=UPI0026DD3C00|nr:hypothetical protein [Clostridium sp.]MDO5038662.1 hypothetical protein [Clostridium sp.]